MSIFRFLLALAAMAGPAAAHEFWISPEEYVIETGDQMQAELRVGEEFSGAGYSFNPKRFDRFDIVTGGLTFPVEGRLGDVPAFNMALLEDGLAIIVHETTDNRLTYTSWAKFEKFATHKDFTDVLDRHIERGLPQDRFVENYRRFAKSLVAVGSGKGADQEVGLRTEIIALDNPYTTAADQLRVKVVYEGAPRANAQVELFEMTPIGDVTVTLHRTDGEGIARIPVQPGHEYLVDAVVMEPLDPGEDPAKEASWISLWAALTFRVPETPLQ